MKRVYVAGTADTKGQELLYVKSLIQAERVNVALVDVGTGVPTVPVDIPASTVAEFHPAGAQSVLRTDDRGAAVAGMVRRLAHTPQPRATSPKSSD